jgi:hypothetical protein
MWQVDKELKTWEPRNVVDDASDRRVPGLGGQVITWVCTKPGCDQVVDAAERPERCPRHDDDWDMEEATNPSSS